MHDGPFDHEHLSEDDIRAFANSIWAQEHVAFTTVGIDIGSSTTHLLFARLLLQRESEGLSSRFEVAERHVLYESPVILTPFRADGLIDADTLGRFIAAQYEAAGLEKDDVDTGAVILTGEAIKRKNARAIDDLFAAQGGKFVCATAGHKLEAVLAAKGAGAVALSRELGNCLLHVDIGGGTTKLALIDKGDILGVSAFAVGGRLLAQDEAGQWTRIDDTAHLVGKEFGIVFDAGTVADSALRDRVAARLADLVMDQIKGVKLDVLGSEIQLTEPLDRRVTPHAVSFSGGVSEYLFGREDRLFGDIARPLAEALQARLEGIKIIVPPQGIRATVTGASQFTVQVSGKTVFISDQSCLNVHNIPVAPLEAPHAGDDQEAWKQAAIASWRGLELHDDSAFVWAFSWSFMPDYVNLHACCAGLRAALTELGATPSLLGLVIDGDVGRSLGLLLKEEFGYTAPLISIDGLRLHAFDYVDIGALIEPPGVVPVIIKSLVI